MQYELKMPDLSTNDSPIRIIRWIVQPGQQIRRGEALLEVETDKATLDVESAVTGTLRDLLCEVDDEVAVGQVMAILEVADKPAGDPSSMAGATEIEPVSATSPAAAAPAAVESPAAKPGGMFAKNRAARGSGPQPPSALAWSAAQRTAARRLQASKQTIPHFYLQTSFHAQPIMDRRRAAEPLKLLWDAFFVRAVATTVARFERFRWRVEGDQLMSTETSAIGLAVDIDDELFVIPVADAADKSWEDISDDIRRGVERLRGGDQEARRTHPALMTLR